MEPIIFKNIPSRLVKETRSVSCTECIHTHTYMYAHTHARTIFHLYLRIYYIFGVKRYLSYLCNVVR